MAFDRSPAVSVGEDTAAAQHNSKPEMEAEGRAPDNMHMDNHRVDLAEKEICSVDWGAERVVT